MMTRHTSLPFIPTRATRQVLGIVEHVRVKRSVALLTGPSGCGKSALVRHLAQMPRTLVYEPETPNTPRLLVNGLLGAMRRPAAPTTLRGVMRVLDPLAYVEVIVVDDVHRLASNTLELLRRLHERTGVGLVLLGPARAARHLTAACPELRARVEGIHEIGALHAYDVFHVLLASMQRPRALWALAATSRALAHRSAGNFRLLLALIEDARGRARRSHRAITPALIDRTVLAINSIYAPEGPRERHSA